MSVHEISHISKAWESISGDLRLFIFSVVRNDNEAEDILHEVFIKIHDKIGTMMESLLPLYNNLPAW